MDRFTLCVRGGCGSTPRATRFTCATYSTARSRPAASPGHRACGCGNDSPSCLRPSPNSSKRYRAGTGGGTRRSRRPGRDRTARIGRTRGGCRSRRARRRRIPRSGARRRSLATPERDPARWPSWPTASRAPARPPPQRRPPRWQQEAVMDWSKRRADTRSSAIALPQPTPPPVPPVESPELTSDGPPAPPSPPFCRREVPVA